MSSDAGVRPKVAYLGPPASYSHQAAIGAFPEADWEPTPTATIKEVFDVVQSGGAAYGVVPFENSTHGSVLFTLDNLADRDGVYGDIYISAEIYLDVHHFLLGYANPRSRRARGDGATGDDNDDSSPPAPLPRQPAERPRGKPLTDLDHVRRVYSHPQALGQTKAFRSTYLAGAETIDVSSTSKAAQLAAADATGASAAVAGEVAAAVHGLDVLAAHIEDRENNTTRFFVIGRGPTAPGGGNRPNAPPALPEKLATYEEEEEAGTRGGRSPYKSLVSFTVPTRAPGALADVLDCFRKGRLDLASINSLPSLVQPFQYLFLLEFEGSRLDDPDGSVASALEGVAAVAQSSRWLGSWLSQRRT